MTAACVGAPQALLTLSQQGTGGGSDESIPFPCGIPHTAQVHFMAGPISTRITLPDGRTASADARAGVRITKNLP